MNTHYHESKRIFKLAIRQILKTINNENIKEAALPAYAHRNPLIDFIFWKRIQSAEKLCLQSKPEVVIDFGCGSGVMSHILSGNVQKVIGIDIQFEPINLVRKHVNFDDNIEFINDDILNVELPPQSVDVIVALDVLEHIHDLQPYLDCFRQLLKPTGKIIVSGPMENRLYQIGRKLAGRDFHGHYHISDIRKIDKQFQTKFELKERISIPPVINLFDVNLYIQRK